jgi:hypothetical protein
MTRTETISAKFRARPLPSAPAQASVAASFGTNAFHWFSPAGVA